MHAQGIKGTTVLTLVVFDERVVLEGLEAVKTGDHEIKTEKGTTFAADLTFLTIGSQTPNTSFLDAALLSSDKSVMVKATLQSTSEEYKHMFSLGDVADTKAPKMALVVGNLSFLTQMPKPLW